jgi:rhamnosyltransferase
MGNSKISVAIATYNGEKYLRQQLHSIYNQTLLPFDVIACDDCSSDSTVNILEEYKQKYGLIYYVNKNNLGFVKNFEKAISFCSEDYILLSDQDDVWLPGKIETLYNKMIALENQYSESPILVHHDSYVVDEGLNNHGRRLFYNKGNGSGLKDLLFGNPKVQGASLMINRKLKEMCIPFPEGLPLHDLYISFVSECFGIRKYVAEPLSLYRQHSNNQIGAISYSTHERITRFINKETILVGENEKNTLTILRKQFSNKLSETNIELIKDYFEILGNDIGFWYKIILVFKNRFNCGGSILKLILKIATTSL